MSTKEYWDRVTPEGPGTETEIPVDHMPSVQVRVRVSTCVEGLTIHKTNVRTNKGKMSTPFSPNPSKLVKGL